MTAQFNIHVDVYGTISTLFVLFVITCKVGLWLMKCTFKYKYVHNSRSRGIVQANFP
jgi:hypothetical protein